MVLMLAIFFIAAAFAPLLFRLLDRNAFLVLALVPLLGLATTLRMFPTVVSGGAVEEVMPWIPTLDVSIALRTDMLAWVLSLLVTGVGFLVFLYCARYFARGEEGLGRFGAVLLAFAGMMYGLVVADDTMMLFLFWEGTTIFSYLLIGQNASRQQSRRAALQALIVTTVGGLSMLIGLIMLADMAGSTRLSEIVAAGAAGQLEATPTLIWAVMLILVGATSKSAIVPFHFWLPGAMAAPTPVSAYLHAAAMVKAGIYLVLRMAPGFQDVPGWIPVLVGLGVFTMLVGGWRAIRQTDLKLLLAYGTVSQLGFLIAISAFGTRDSALAAVTLLLAHGLFKAALFLVVGIIDHRAGTRDLRKLSGLGRQAPVLAVIAVIAVASMAGLPPTLGYVAKEAVYTSILDLGSTVGYLAVAGIFLGSVFTVAYSARFLWGAFARKPGVDMTTPVEENYLFLVSPTILSLLTIVTGTAAYSLTPILAIYAEALPRTAGEDYYLALWHGIVPALGLTIASILLGVMVFIFRDRVERWQSAVPNWIDLHRTYRSSMADMERVAIFVTSKTQRGSLPFYLAVTLVVLTVSMGAVLLTTRSWPDGIRAFDYPAQIFIAAVMIAASITAARSEKRFAAVILVGATGFAMVAFFALQGAPDLALTQTLVEIITLTAFVLVLRRLPVRIGEQSGGRQKLIRAAIGVSVGVVMMVATVVAIGARTAGPVSEPFPELSYVIGHGKNVVNVILVDIRAWDTLGEISVVVAAATGVASLVFVQSRATRLQRLERDRPTSFVQRHVPITDAVSRPRLRQLLSLDAAPVSDATHRQEAEEEAARQTEASRSAWLVAGRTLGMRNRSILLEVTVRLVFHSMLVFSIYLLFTGHNLPGGGFAAGLVAGLGLIFRYLAGGRFELAEAVPLDPGRLMGVGLVFAVAAALGGLLWGDHVFQSGYWSATVPFLGDLSFVTPTIFDIGVYLIVVGFLIDVLRSLGAEVDRQQEEDEEAEHSEHHVASRVAEMDYGEGWHGEREGPRL